MASSGRTSSAPLLPVNPERYRRLGLSETRSASSLRSGSAPATVRRRCSNSLFCIQQISREDLGTLGKQVGGPHVAFIFGLYAGCDKAADFWDHFSLGLAQIPAGNLIQNLLGLSSARRSELLESFGFFGIDDFTNRRSGRFGGGDRRRQCCGRGGSCGRGRGSALARRHRRAASWCLGPRSGRFWRRFDRWSGFSDEGRGIERLRLGKFYLRLRYG